MTFSTIGACLMSSETRSAARVYSSEEERQIIVLGSKAAGWRDRIDWRKAREGRDLGDCNLDCDACYRSRLFSLGLEVLRAAHAPAAATNPKQGYTPEIRLRLVTFPYWRWVMEVVYV